MSSYLAAPLREYFSHINVERLPAALADLVARFEVASARDGHAITNEFRDDLVKALPALRTFALSLTGDVTRADDLVQETFARAWAKWHHFTPGTNFTAWLFTILRNQFYTEVRKRKREVEDAECVQAGKLLSPADQEDASTLKVVWERISGLPVAQRQALLLVGAEGRTYEEAAALIGCQVGTVKSRVSRARALLAERLGLGDDRLPA
ncbi:sigma-70 family RNA polymerase sigma factor (plasmid) [Methylobacterium currus]|uniref:sigma-70 family RNA polymerase sigma factor n=1 Tax=Methylobacterium currus TaxID=2051553 RepID=UPI001E649065|nr:sigma-70 family RNA polymerase sigma factor [Methylobacterium currus]UHC20001.1 sigma-70 family RNA polymerase sigma factor [Methylobacterium currus]